MTLPPDDEPRTKLLGFDPQSIDDDDSTEPFDTSAMLPDLESDIERERGSLVARLRALATPVRIVLASGAALGFGAFVGITACRTDLATYSLGRWAVEATLLAATMVMTVALAMRPAFRPELDRPRLIAALALGLAIAFGIAVVPAPAPGATDLGPIAPPDWTAGLPCLTIGMLVGLPTYLIARLLDRGPSRGGFLAAGAAALAGNLALTMHCPLGDVGHRVSSHASLGVLFLLSLGLAAVVEHRFPAGRNESSLPRPRPPRV